MAHESMATVFHITPPRTVSLDTISHTKLIQDKTNVAFVPCFYS